VVTLNPYLSFKNTARPAMEFYHSVFGGELTTSTFAASGAPVEKGEEELLMHSQITVNGKPFLMAADTPQHMAFVPAAGISISLSGGQVDDASLRDYWAKLSASGRILQPLEKAPWGDAFGMCVDGYGITWMVNILAAE